MSGIVWCSVKGSPGVTTLATLAAGLWPAADHREVLVVEADIAGGDLAGRFGLSGRVGWSSLRSSERRSAEQASVLDHLQALPGGLTVLAAGSGVDVPAADDPAAELVWDACRDIGGGGVFLPFVDVGRVPAGGGGASGWMARCDRTIVVTRSGAADLIHVRQHAEWLIEAADGAVGVVVVGGTVSPGEVEHVTGLEGVGRVPCDVPAAAIASGGPGRTGRLTGSTLVAAARRLSADLASPGDRPGMEDATPTAGGSEQGRRRWRHPSGLDAGRAVRVAPWAGARGLTRRAVTAPVSLPVVDVVRSDEGRGRPAGGVG
jgi:hypothetical protein